MPNEVEVMERIEILFAVQGCGQPMSQMVDSRMTVAEFGAVAARAALVEDEVEVFLEDDDEPLVGGLVLVEHLAAKFAPLHVARRGATIMVTIEYNGRTIEHAFRPNATVEKVIIWTIGPEGFGLEGGVGDYQLKLGGNVLSPGSHLGQVPHPHHKVKLDLVFKIKPQG